jgi:hypothetical protein
MDMFNGCILRCGKGMGTMVDINVAEIVAALEVRSHFLLKLPAISKVEQNVKRFRHPLAPEIFRRLVNELRADGFDVTEAKPGSGCDAVFEVRFPKFCVAALIAAWNLANVNDYCIATSWGKHFWQRVDLRAVFEGWDRACSAIEEKLREDPHVRSLQRLTENDCDLHCEQDTATT